MEFYALYFLMHEGVNVEIMHRFATDNASFMPEKRGTFYAYSWIVQKKKYYKIEFILLFTLTFEYFLAIINVLIFANSYVLTVARHRELKLVQSIFIYNIKKVFNAKMK